MSSCKALMISLVCLLVLIASGVDGVCRNCSDGCTTKDCHGHDITQQTYCTEVAEEQPLRECEWYMYGLARHTDQVGCFFVIVYLVQ